MSSSVHEFLREYSPMQSIFIRHEDAFTNPDIQDLILNSESDPDFFEERIIKLLRLELADSSLPTYMPRPKNNTGPTGYLYFQYFDDRQCGGKLLSETGVGLDSCLSYPGMKLSYRVGLVYAGCDELKYIGQSPLEFSTDCNLVADNTSFIGFCHNQPSIPVNFEGVMDAGYEGDVNCTASNDVIQYVNTPSQSCYLGVPPGTFTFPFPDPDAINIPSNYSWDLYSYKFLCNGNTYADHFSGATIPQNYSVEIYWDSYFCDKDGDNVQVYSYAASCDVEDLDFPFAPSPLPTELPTSMPSRHKSPVPTESPSSRPSVDGSTYLPTSRPTRGPTSQPSAAPSLNGTAAPSYASTAAPTQWEHSLEYYYAQEAFKGTIKRSCVYTNEPTIAPTYQPTFEPTDEPTIEPTAAPSTPRPSLAPASTRFPTQAVTFAPSTRRPTASPTTCTPTNAPTLVITDAPTVEPTWAPAAAPVTILDVAQVISGLNATVFNNPATKAQYEEAFIAAVVKSLAPAVTASDVYNLLVKSFSASTSSSASVSSGWFRMNGGHVRVAATTPQSQASYSIYVLANSTSTSSASLTSQLQSSVASGDFDQYLTTRKFPGHGSSAGGPRYSSAGSGSYRGGGAGGNLHQMDDDDDVSFHADARKMSSNRSTGNKPAVELRPTNATTASSSRGSVPTTQMTAAVPAKSPFNSSKQSAASANVTTITKVQEDNWFSFDDAFATSAPAAGPAATVPRQAQPTLDADLLFFPSVPAQVNTQPQVAAPIKPAPMIAPPPPSNPVKRPPPNPFAASSASTGQANPPSTLFNASLPTTIPALSGSTGSKSPGPVPMLPPPPGGNKPPRLAPPPSSSTAAKPANAAPWLSQDDNFDPL
eukprot:gene5590-3999_t